MQKIQIFASSVNGLKVEPAPEWDAAIVVVGRIPCVGEFIDLSNLIQGMGPVELFEVVQVTHGVNVEKGTFACVSLLAN